MLKPENLHNPCEERYRVTGFTRVKCVTYELSADMVLHFCARGLRLFLPTTWKHQTQSLYPVTGAFPTVTRGSKITLKKTENRPKLWFPLLIPELETQRWNITVSFRTAWAIMQDHHHHIYGEGKERGRKKRENKALRRKSALKH